MDSIQTTGGVFTADIQKIVIRNIEKKNEERSKKVIRILQISDSMKQRSGITSFLMNYNEFIDREQMIFDYLIIDNEEDIGDKIDKFGGNIYYMPKLGMKNIKEYKEAINMFFKEHRYDIVHSHFYQIDPIVKPIATRYGVKHFISHSHNTKYADGKIRSIRNCVMSIPIRFSSTEFCGCSVKACDFLFGKYILKMRGKKSVVIPNAINYKKFYFEESMRHQIREEYGIDDDATVYGNIGSMKPQKNQLFLLDIFKCIYNSNSKSVLMIVGDGDLRTEIEKKANALGILHNIVLTGTTAVPQHYYNAFDCYVFPSRYEGFGLSLLEAEVNGLPCICSNTIPEEPIISKNVSIVSLKDSCDKWAEKCVEMSKIGRNTSEVDPTYDLNVAVLKLMKFYEELK